MRKTRLFCIPYAGGSAIIYTRWKKYLNSSIELCPIELAGRGIRSSEPPFSDLKQVVEDVYSQIYYQINGGPYVLFGHSMGSLIVFELYHKIKNQNRSTPLHIFFSGRNAPNINKNTEFYKMSDIDFKKEILKYNAIPDIVFDNEIIYRYFMPILRADYRVIDSYKYIPKKMKISCQVTVLNGLDDVDIKFSELDKWNDLVQEECTFCNFSGGHFFINERMKEVVEVINDTIYKNTQNQ
ncbi:thioesterase II family protein [Clostridium kluyveri]|uniref:Predicted thioesterase n=2 Tax=Clostridium kluyveri TaxID=1534 RepID=A5N8Z6_CLOK5|nr:thioesterase domain-containing protein [Clostridium kluyveri]EDK33777.1 Predicted thioesterase [Clostridium kluyveri DSM 555]